jgi:hypothetical protein
MVDEPEPYESPPVASRFRVSDAGSGPGAPQSFELRSDPRTQGVAAIDVGDPLLTGGPKFAGSAPIVAPVGPPGPRADRRGGSPGPMPGTFQKDWSRSAPRPLRRTRRRLTQVVVLATLAAGACLAAPHVRSLLANQSMPAVLGAYVHGRGVSYAPAGQGYAVRLPAPPHTRDILVAASRAEPALLIRRSIVSGTNFEIVISTVELSAGTALRNGLSGALHDAQLVGYAPTHVRRVVVDGTSAFGYELHASPAIDARVLVGAHHLYVLSVQSTSAGAVLDAVTQSLRLSP